MSETTTGSSGGIGVTGLLGVAFIVLKLCHVINWPWLWVLAPFWIGLALFAILAACALTAFGVVLLHRRLTR